MTPHLAYEIKSPNLSFTHFLSQSSSLSILCSVLPYQRTSSAPPNNIYFLTSESWNVLHGLAKHCSSFLTHLEGRLFGVVALLPLFSVSSSSPRPHSLCLLLWILSVTSASVSQPDFTVLENRHCLLGSFLNLQGTLNRLLTGLKIILSFYFKNVVIFRKESFWKLPKK